MVPSCVYPQNLARQIQRITVPECSDCKKAWQDAETQFRNMLMIAGEANAHVRELWDGPVSRSFDKPSGRRWLADLVDRFVPVETADGPRQKVYPGEDERVMLVVRRIIRGLCHHENVATGVADARVQAVVMVHVIPEEYRNQMTWGEMGQGFFRYGFAVVNDAESGTHSAWSLTFFGRTKFFGAVLLPDSSAKKPTD